MRLWRDGLAGAIILCVWACLAACSSPQATSSSPPGAALIPPAALSPPSPQTLSALKALALSADRSQAYLGMSALVGWYRAAGQAQAADALLAARLDRLNDDGLRPLFGLWYGDQALFDGDPKLAMGRYTLALESAGSRAFVGRRLSVQIRTQRAVAAHLAGDHRRAEADLMAAAREADSIRAASLLRKAADFAWERGERRHARRLRRAADDIRPNLTERAAMNATQVGERVQRDQDRFYAWRIPPLESLDLRAPWQAGIAQRAGGIGPGFGGWAGYIGRLFTRGRRGDSCGRGFTGYYYARGSHRKGWYAGRDQYAVDFTLGKSEGSRFGNLSFGVQLRAAAQGIVTYAYYGTRTFWNGWDGGPPPAANRVNLLHFLGGSGLLEKTLADLDSDFAIYRLRGLQSWSLHMVGLDEPCDPRSGRCIQTPGLVSFGQFVWQGSPVGYEDSTGLSAMSHLHYSLMVPCHARDKRCAADDPRLTHISVPIALEGRTLGDNDTGSCVMSTNHFSLEGAEGLPPEVDALLKSHGHR